MTVVTWSIAQVAAAPARAPRTASPLSDMEAAPPRRGSGSAGRPGHVRVLGDLDAVAFGRADDLLPGPLLRGRALDIRLVPAGHRVADVRFVVDRQVLAVVTVDVRELVRAQSVAPLLRQRGHQRPPALGDEWSWTCASLSWSALSSPWSRSL